MVLVPTDPDEITTAQFEHTQQQSPHPGGWGGCAALGYRFLPAPAFHRHRKQWHPRHCGNDGFLPSRDHSHLVLQAPPRMMLIIHFHTFWSFQPAMSAWESPCTRMAQWLLSLDPKRKGDPTPSNRADRHFIDAGPESENALTHARLRRAIRWAIFPNTPHTIMTSARSRKGIVHACTIPTRLPHFARFRTRLVRGISGATHLGLQIGLSRASALPPPSGWLLSINLLELIQCIEEKETGSPPNQILPLRMSKIIFYPQSC